MDDSESRQAPPHQRKQDLDHRIQCDPVHEVPGDHQEAENEVSSPDTCSSETSESSSSTYTNDVINPALDGGYGWVIVMASFFNAFIIDGISNCFGLLFPVITEKFDSSAAVTSFAGSLFVSFLLMGTAAAELVKRFGFRAVSMAGGILSCLAFVIAAFSPNIILFILSYGLLAGCASGLVFLPSVVVVNTYFHRRRGIANGIITSGSGAGLLVLAPLVNFLLETYSLNGTVLIMAGILLHMSVFSSFYCPLKRIIQPDSCDHEDYRPQRKESQSSNLSTEDLAEFSLKETAENALEEVENIEEQSANLHRKDGYIFNKGGKSSISSDLNSEAGEPGNVTELKAKSYKEYLVSLLNSGVPPHHIPSNGPAQYSLKKAVNQERPHKSSLWRSEYQLNSSSSTQSQHSPHPCHSSVQNIPTWCQDKGSSYIPQNSIMKHLNQHQKDSSRRCHHHHHYHHQHKHHSHHGLHHQHPEYLSIDHGSNFYLTGSISTLMSLHSKHIIHSLQGSVSTAFHNQAPPLNSSGLQISIMEVPADFSSQPETEKSLLFGQNNVENELSINQTEPAKSSLSLTRSVDLHTSIRSLTKSGYTSLSEVAVDLCMEGEVPVSLPPAGYTLKQLLCMPSFHLFSLGASLIQIGYYVIGTFLADYAYQNGLTSSHTPIMMGILGGLNIFGRLLSGALAGLKIDPLHLNNASLLLGGIACLLVPVFTEFWSLCLFAGLFGFFLGFFPPLQPLILVEYFGLESLASAFGFLSTVKGVASIVGAPLAGYIYDATGKYFVSFVFAGATFVLSSLVHCFMPWSRRCG